jgi:hypothetical protein
LFAERFRFKHTFSFLFSLLAYVSVAGLIAILGGPRYAWIGPVALALLPRFWGHSFFSPKDIPFATLFAWSTLIGAHLIDRYLRAGERLHAGLSQTTLASAGFGALVGLLTGIRMAGLFVLLFILVAHLVLRLSKGIVFHGFGALTFHYGLIVVVWLATTVLVYPASWNSPLAWFQQTLEFTAHYEWPKNVLFDGEFISAYQLPWHYLLTWALITIPTIHQVTFVLGLILIAFRYSRLSDFQRAAAILILLQICFLPILGIVKHSTMYDGMRHFFFVLPGIAAIAGTGLVWLYQKLPTRTTRVLFAATALILVIPIGIDMVTLHPYQHVYFNRAFGGLGSAYKRYETDYWALSVREGIEWINDRGENDSRVIVGAPLYSAKLFASPGLHLYGSITDFEDPEAAKPYYYLAMPKHRAQEKFPECKVVHQVTRHKTPLAIVKLCE